MFENYAIIMLTTHRGSIFCKICGLQTIGTYKTS